MGLLSPRVQHPRRYIDAALWQVVWNTQMAAERIEYPAYGVNVFEASHQHLDRVTTNIVQDQNVVGFELFGGKVAFHETYDMGETVQSIVIIRWARCPAGKGARDQALAAMKERGLRTLDALELFFEFFGKVEAYNWKMTRALPPDPSTYRKLLQTTLW